MKRNQPTTWLLATALTTGLLLATGCGDSGGNSATDRATPNANASALPDDLFLTTAPQGALPITQLKASAKEGDPVVVRVIVGGRMDPIVQGRASAAIIDAGLSNACTSEDDHCQTPWDYCCTPQEDITANLATLQVVDPEGRVLNADLSERIKPLSTLIIAGTVGPRPDTQVLTINATGIYIEETVQ